MLVFGSVKPKEVLSKNPWATGILWDCVVNTTWHHRVSTFLGQPSGPQGKPTCCPKAPNPQHCQKILTHFSPAGLSAPSRNLPRPQPARTDPACKVTSDDRPGPEKQNDEGKQLVDLKVMIENKIFKCLQFKLKDHMSCRVFDVWSQHLKQPVMEVLPLSHPQETSHSGYQLQQFWYQALQSTMNLETSNGGDDLLVGVTVAP